MGSKTLIIMSCSVGPYVKMFKLKRCKIRTRGSCFCFFVFIALGFIYQAFTFDDASSISIAISGSNSVEVGAGGYGAATQTITVSNTNTSGYILSFKSSGVSDLVNTSDNALVIPTISLPDGADSLTASSISSGYGYSLDGTNFFPVPASTDVGANIGETNSATESAYDLTFGVRVPDDAAPGFYAQTFVVTAVAKVVTYEVSYDNNNGSGAPSDETYADTENTYTYTVSNTEPTRSEYEFVGWHEGTALSDLSRGDSIAGLSLIQPGATLNLTSVSPSTTLYATWRALAGDEEVVVDNGDGTTTTTTTTYDASGDPTFQTVATTDTDGNVSTQEKTYVNGEAVVTGYTIDTSGNETTGVLSLDGTEGIDTGVIAFDGNDFTIALVATLNEDNISGTANPILSFRDYTDGGAMINTHDISVSWLNEDNTSSYTVGTTLSFGYTKYTGGTSTNGSYYFRYIEKPGSSNYYWTYGMGTTEKTLKFVVQSTSNIISAYIYTEDEILVARPASTTVLPQDFDFTSSNLDDITIEVGHFYNSSTDTHKYTVLDIVSLDVSKTLSGN